MLDRGRNTQNRPEIDRNRPGILGLISSSLGADLGPKSTISGRILKSFRGPRTDAPLAKGSWQGRSQLAAQDGRFTLSVDVFLRKDFGLSGS